MTIDPWTHVLSNKMVAMATTINDLFLTMVVYMSITLHKFVFHLYGCHGNIMLPWQLSNMFVTSIKWPQALNHMCNLPLLLSRQQNMFVSNNHRQKFKALLLTIL